MSTQIRTSNQSRASTKIVIGFIVLLALGYFGKDLFERLALRGTVLTPIAPGQVNIVGVDVKNGGYHIVVADGIAQLVQSPNGSFGPGDSDPGSSDNSDSDSDKKRVPLKELIETLQGKSEAVGQYVAVLNDMKQDDLPPTKIEVDWKAADIQKAINGDAKLKQKLQDDLNTNLDGTPQTAFRPNAFENGIVIHLPVTLNVPTVDGVKPVTGDLLVPFQSNLMKALESRVKDESSIFDPHNLAGFYGEVGKTYQDRADIRQNMSNALKQIVSKDNVSRMIELPQKMLDSVQILANESLITSASYRSEDTNKGPVYDMDINLTDEGRKRLWQYTKDHVGDQLLLVVDGVAIAAPRVGAELAQSSLTISNLPDERIVKDAVTRTNSHSKNQK